MLTGLLIEQLDLSQRTYNCLKRSQITKVGQVMQMSEDELLSLRNFGQKSLEELRDLVAEAPIGVRSWLGWLVASLGQAPRPGSLSLPAIEIR